MPTITIWKQIDHPYVKLNIKTQAFFKYSDQAYITVNFHFKNQVDPNIVSKYMHAQFSNVNETRCVPDIHSNSFLRIFCGVNYEIPIMSLKSVAAFAKQHHLVTVNLNRPEN